MIWKNYIIGIIISHNANIYVENVVHIIIILCVVKNYIMFQHGELLSQAKNYILMLLQIILMIGHHLQMELIVKTVLKF